MAIDLVQEAQVWPTNALGEIIVMPGLGTSVVTGQLPSNFIPTDVNTGAVRLAGIPNIVVSSSAPSDADGQPNGTIYIQTV